MNYTTPPVAMATTLMQQISTFILTVSALAMAVLTVGAIVGLLPWAVLPLTIGDAQVANAGMWGQIAVTLLLLALVGFLPANNRVRRLEMTNRNFHISMEDVAKAYDFTHRADREGAFELSREFDAMRDRIAWMREHPELVEMEHDVLELAAQMSVESRDLAQIYSTKKVERANTFLRQRQQEIEDYRQRISMAQSTVHEIKRWMQALSVEEGLAEKQLERLQLDLADVTEAMRVTGHTMPQNVVDMAEAPRRKADRAAKTAARPVAALAEKRAMKTVARTEPAEESAKPTPKSERRVRPVQAIDRPFLTGADEDIDDEFDILMTKG